MMEGRNSGGLVKFHGFDDIDEENEFTEGTAIDIPEQNQARNKKKGGKKKNRRERLMASLENELTTSVAPKTTSTAAVNGSGSVGEKYLSYYSNISSSRLLQELHNRERLYGMSRDEAQHLVADKLLFLGDAELRAVRTRRFCLAVTSRETFDLGNGSRIPAEIVTVSMEHGRINSILRLFPTYTRTFEKDPIALYQSHKMQCVYWNPSMVSDANQVHECWSRFLDTCLHSFLLVPLHNKHALLDFLRTANEIRSILNERPTVSICLSRVVPVEDYLIASQHVMGSNINPAGHPSMDLSLLDHALEYCRFHLHCMNMIFMTATLAGNEIMCPKTSATASVASAQVAPTSTTSYPHWIDDDTVVPTVAQTVAQTAAPTSNETPIMRKTVENETTTTGTTVTTSTTAAAAANNNNNKKNDNDNDNETNNDTRDYVSPVITKGFQRVFDWMARVDFEETRALDVIEDETDEENSE